MDIRVFMKRKSISNCRSVENISDKRLRIEVQPAQTNGIERTKHFVNVHLHCIVSNMKRISKISTLPPPPFKMFCRRPWMHWFRFLGHKAWYCLVQYVLSHSKP